MLIDRGLVDLHAPVTAYVPEASDSGYAGATIRDLLDMRTGVAFRETYTALDAEVRVMERSMGWRPALPGDPPGAYPYLATLGRDGPHGGNSGKNLPIMPSMAKNPVKTSIFRLTTEDVLSNLAANAWACVCFQSSFCGGIDGQE